MRRVQPFTSLALVLFPEAWLIFNAPRPAPLFNWLPEID